MPNILPVLTKETYEAVVNASLEDDHYALAPTHYWKNKQGEISGYFSNGMLQVCHFWMRRDSKPRDSYETIQACKKIARATNPIIAKQGRTLVCCGEESPFYSHLPKHFKFKPIVQTVLFMAEV